MDGQDDGKSPEVGLPPCPRLNSRHRTRLPRPAAHQTVGLACRVAEPSLAQSVLPSEAIHYPQDRPADLVRRGDLAHHPPTRRAPLLDEAARGRQLDDDATRAVHLDAEPPRQGARQAGRDGSDGETRHGVPARARRYRVVDARAHRARRGFDGAARQKVFLDHGSLAEEDGGESQSVLASLGVP